VRDGRARLGIIRGAKRHDLPIEGWTSGTLPEPVRKVIVDENHGSMEISGKYFPQSFESLRDLDILYYELMMSMFENARRLRAAPKDVPAPPYRVDYSVKIPKGVYHIHWRTGPRYTHEGGLWRCRVCGYASCSKNSVRSHYKRKHRAEGARGKSAGGRSWID
jgi:hypothetical protein